jgi:hypothetical protein
LCLEQGMIDSLEVKVLCAWIIRHELAKNSCHHRPHIVKELATYLRGWLGYFGDCQNAVGTPKS